MFAFSVAGQRSDLIEIRDKLLNNVHMSSIQHDHFGSWCRYRGSFEQFVQDKMKPRDFKTRVTVLVGPPGSGKTRFVHDECAAEGRSVYMKQRSQWWDLYDGVKSVCIDDFYGWLPYDECLRLMDRYELLVQPKNKNVQFRSPSLYFTSNKMPIEWWSEELLKKVVWGAFVRRVDRFIYMEMNGVFGYDGPSYQDFCGYAAQRALPAPT